MRRTFLVVLLVAALVAVTAGEALAIYAYEGPTEFTGTVIRVYSGNSFAVFDGERTSVVVLEGIETPKRGEEYFMEAAEFLHGLIFGKTVKVKMTRKAPYMTYAQVIETEKNIDINATVLNQDFAEVVEGSAYATAVTTLTLQSNEFYSPPAGFSIKKPEEWVFLSIQDIETEEEGVRLEDRDLERAARSRADTPLVTITKYPEPYEGFNPKAQAYLKSIGGLLGKSPVELMETAVPALRKTFLGFTIMEGIDSVTVGGRKAAYMKASYTVEVPEKPSYQVISRIYLVPRGTVMFMISLSSAAADESTVLDDFTKMVESVKVMQ